MEVLDLNYNELGIQAIQEEKIAIENLERCIFVLENIKDKNLIKIVNIF